MQCELAALDVLFRATLFDQPLGQLRTLAHRHHPPGDIAAEDIEDYVEIEVGPLGWSEQLGDVPTPELLGSRRQKFRLLVRRMSEFVVAFAGMALLFKHSIHGANRAKIVTLIQK